MFQENKTGQIFRKTNIFYPPHRHMHVCVLLGGKKCSFSGKFGVLYFLEIFAPLVAASDLRTTATFHFFHMCYQSILFALVFFNFENSYSTNQLWTAASSFPQKSW